MAVPHAFITNNHIKPLLPERRGHFQEDLTPSLKVGGGMGFSIYRRIPFISPEFTYIAKIVDNK
jgi:hypothetical protein